MEKTISDAASDQRQGDAWEGEGGGLGPSQRDPLPDGVIAVTTVQYRVGPYSYSTLDDALAEHRRRTSR